MAYEFKFPDVGEGIVEGEIVKWKVNVGDVIKADQVLVEIETDKAIVEIPSPKSGKIIKRIGNEGETINVHDVLVVIEEEGSSSAGSTATQTSSSAQKSSSKAAASGSSSPAQEKYTGSVVGFLEEASDDVKPQTSTVHRDTKTNPPALLKVRILAKKLGIDLATLKGTGPQGRITEEDVEHAANVLKPAKLGVALQPQEYAGPVERVPLKGLRKTIAKKLLESHAVTVLITHFSDVDATELVEVKKKNKDAAEKAGVHLTYLPFIIQAVVSALKKHPKINASLEGEEIVFKKYYHIGLAVDTDDGLIAPIIKNADTKDVFALASEISSLAEKARSRKLEMNDLKGGTFTLTNLGTLDVTHFTPMMNSPESAILGIGKLVDTPVVRDGAIVIRKMLPLSLSYDHRIIDGADAARFMQDVTAYLEHPNTVSAAPLTREPAKKEVKLANNQDDDVTDLI